MMRSVMKNIACQLEHSVEAEVSSSFAWSWRTDINNWDDPPAQFQLDGPFASGSWGTTLLPGQEPLRWQIRDVRPGAGFNEGRSRAGLEVVTTPYATGGPWAAVPATPIGSEPSTVTDFRIRAWAEGAAARIIVFAVSPRPDGTETETQIASIALAPGDSQEIKATEKYNARPVTISVSARQ